jgi:glycosyltransferase involved in cell wall biosynthesis
MTGITSSPYPWLEAKGWVSDEEKLELLQTASLLLVPSAFEGEPMVVLEAISCGLSVLCSDRVHSLPPSIEVAPFENEGAWVAKIIHLLQEPTDSEHLKAHSRTFAIQAISTHWNKIYQGLLAQ